MLPKKFERKKRKTETFLGVCFISEPLILGAVLFCSSLRFSEVLFLTL